jgi:hypothetical protein
MEDIATLLYLAGSAIVIGLFSYIVYINKKRRQSEEVLENFLIVLSKSYHTANWDRPDPLVDTNDAKQAVANTMNKRIEHDMKNEFESFLKGLYSFPHGCFKFFAEDPATNRFMGKAFPKIKEAYKAYKYDRCSLTYVQSTFFKETENLILEELNIQAKETN